MDTHLLVDRGRSLDSRLYISPSAGCMNTVPFRLRARAVGATVPCAGLDKAKQQASRSCQDDQDEQYDEDDDKDADTPVAPRGCNNQPCQLQPSLVNSLSFFRMKSFNFFVVRRSFESVLSTRLPRSSSILHHTSGGATGRLR